MLQTRIVGLLLRFSLFWCIFCSLLREAESKAVSGRLVRSYEDWNNNTRSEIGLDFYISSLKFTLMKLETEISRLKENVKKEQAENKQLKSDNNDLQLKYSGLLENLKECQNSKNYGTPPAGVIIKGLREQMLEDINSGDWSRSIELMKRHLDESTVAYKQLNNITTSYVIDYPLRAAVEGYIELIQVMLDNELPINNEYFLNNTMLHAAVQNRHYNLVKFLIERGADVNVRGFEGSTPLHWAAYNCEKNIVQLLIVSGADINASDDDGETPLHWVDALSCESAKQWLIHTGSDNNLL